jgi:ABC-2 type transport system ATP-binding protein
MIRAANVSKFYGPFVAVREVSFEVPSGQVVALLGPNGAGKTTVMRILTGVLAPSEGCATVAGHNMQTERVAALARLGYLPENGPLYADMTPLALLRFFGEARGLRRSDLEARVADVVAQCELQEVIETPIGKLSKGLRQRVGLAQALLHDPEILILDEPTAGLDPNQVRRFRSHIQQLRQRKTVLISTHMLREVEALADRMLLVHMGRLVFDGAPDDMRENGSLEEPFYRMTHDP